MIHFAQRDRLAERPDAELAIAVAGDDALIVEILERVGVFGDAVKKAVRRANAAGNGPVRHLVIDMEAVTDVDVTGAEAFEALLVWLEREKIDLSFSRVRPDAHDRLVELGLLGAHTTFETNRAAIAALVKGEA